MDRVGVWVNAGEERGTGYRGELTCSATGLLGPNQPIRPQQTAQRRKKKRLQEVDVGMYAYHKSCRAMKLQRSFPFCSLVVSTAVPGIPDSFSLYP